MDLAAAHAGFVLAAYAATAVVFVGLTVTIVLDYRRQRRTLAELETPGMPRRRRAAETAP